MADDCIFYCGGGCSCTAGWQDTPGSESKPPQNKQRQSIWCLWMLLCVKSLKHELRLKSPLSHRGFAASDAPALTWKGTEGKAVETVSSALENKLLALLLSNRANNQPAIAANHHSFNITDRIAIPTWDVNETAIGY